MTDIMLNPPSNISDGPAVPDVNPNIAEPATRGEAPAAPEPAPTIDYRLHYERVFLTPHAHLGGAPSLRLSVPDGAEGIVLFLTGRVNVEVNPVGAEKITSILLGGRQHLFDSGPDAIVVGPGASATIEPCDDAAEVLVAWTGIDQQTHTTRTGIVYEGDVRVHDVGEDHYYRTVYEIVGETQGMTTRLCVGETEQDPGVWSSWPHHEFDRHPELATQFDEVFLVYAKPISPIIRDSEIILRRRGIMVDGSQVDDVLALPNGAEVRVPLGYHPICAPLAARLRYVWVYAGPPELKKSYAKRAADNGYYA